MHLIWITLFGELRIFCKQASFSRFGSTWLLTARVQHCVKLCPILNKAILVDVNVSYSKTDPPKWLMSRRQAIEKRGKNYTIPFYCFFLSVFISENIFYCTFCSNTSKSTLRENIYCFHHLAIQHDKKFTLKI